MLIAIHLAFLFLTLPVFLHQVRDDGYNENLFKRFPKHPACGFTFIYSCSTSIVNFILIRIEFERNLVNSTEQPLDRQIESLMAYGVKDHYIIKDKRSDKDFDRPWLPIM